MNLVTIQVSFEILEWASLTIEVSVSGNCGLFSMAAIEALNFGSIVEMLNTISSSNLA